MPGIMTVVVTAVHIRLQRIYREPHHSVPGNVSLFVVVETTVGEIQLKVTDHDWSLEDGDARRLCIQYARRRAQLKPIVDALKTCKIKQNR